MPTIEEFMKQYGSGAQKQPEQQPVQHTEPAPEQQPRRTVAEFMKQYGGDAYKENPHRPEPVMAIRQPEQPRQTGLFQFPEIPKTEIKPNLQQNAPDSRARQDYLKELHELEAQAGYITDTEQSLENARRRREITDALEEMDRAEGNAPRYYDEATRATGVLEGWANRTGGSYLSTLGTLGQLAELQDETGQALADSEYAGYITDDLTASNMRQAVESGQEVKSDGSFRTNREMLKKADELLGRNEELMAKVYNGTNGADRLLADVTGGALDLASDAVANKFLPGFGLINMGVRSFGQGAYDQRQKGGDVGKQILSGSKSAAIEILTEKIGGPFENIYGKTLTGKATRSLLNRFDNPLLRRGLQLASSALSEGAEEFMGDLLNPLADRLLRLDDGTGKIFKDGWFADAMYDAAIGGILGLLGESVKVSAGEEPSARQTEEMKQNAIEGAEQALDRAIAERDLKERPAMPAEAAEAEQNAQEKQSVPQSPSEAPESPLPQEGIPAPAEGAETPTAQAQELNSRQGETGIVNAYLRDNLERLQAEKPTATVSTSDLYSMPGGSFIEKARALFQRIIGNVNRPGFGTVEINNRSMKDDFSHGLGEAKAAVVPAIPAVIQNGVQLDVQRQWRGKPYDGYVFAAPVMLDGKPVYVAAIVKQTSKNKFYLHEVVSSSGDVIKSGSSEKANQTSLAANGDAGTFNELPIAGDDSPTTNVAQTGENVNGHASGDGLTVQGADRIATPPSETRNDSGPQPGQKRSQTESHTLQHMAEVTGGEQEELYYTPKSERESLTNAMNRVRSDMNGEMQKLMDKEMWNGEDIDTGLSIMGLLQMDGVRTGDFSAAQAWSRIVQARGTESGRALQAFSKWTRSGVAAATQSMNALAEAKNLSEEDRTRITNDVYQFAQEYDSIEDGDLKSIRELIKKQAKYRNTWTFSKGKFDKMLNEMTDFDWLKEYAMRQMMNISADFTEEADFGQKAKTWQVNAQLSRLGTFFRNIGGNGVFGVQDTLSQDFFGVALDALIGKATGKRTVALDKGWLSSDARKGARQGMVRSILEVAGDVDMGDGGSKYGQGANRTFKMTGNAFDRMMSRWEQLLGYSLTSSDRTFRGAIEAEQMRGLEGFENLTEEERQALAENMADYRLFQNHGLAYRISKGAHDVMNVAGFGGQMGQTGRQGGFGLGDMVMPYPGVPANLWAKALEYSPANVAKGTVEMVKLLIDIKNGKTWSVTQQQNAVMDVARGLHGTALIVGLAALFRAGIFKNADDEEDPDAKALAAAEGRQGVQINLSAALRWAQGGSKEWQKGDELMKIDWLEPMNAFLAIASLAADDLDNPGAYMMDTMEGSAQALMDMPVMTSIANIMDSYNYSKADTTGGKLAETAVNFGVDSLTGLLPAPLSQTARALDPYYRETAGDTAAETALNRVMNAIPGLRQMLDPKLDNFGRPKENPESAYDRWMNSFVRPGQISDYKAGEMEQALDALAERTGDPDVYPDRKAPSSFTINGEKVQLDNDQKQFYQAVYGQTCEKYYSSVLNSEDYADLSDAEKSWLLEEVRTYAKYKAQQAVAGGMGRGDYENKQGRNLDNVLRSGVDLPGYLLGQKNANADGEGSLKNQEVYDWLLGSDYTGKQKQAIWDANKVSSNKQTWQEYYDTNPVTLLTNIGLSQEYARRMFEAVDTDEKNGMTQEELFNYWKSHADQEAIIREYWDNQRGFSTSWADYRRKHS